MKAHRSRDLRVSDDCFTWSNFSVIVFLLKQDGKRYVALILNFLGMTSASAVDWRFRNHYFYFRITVSVSDIGTCFWFQFLYSEQKFVFWRFSFISDTSRWFLFLFEATVKLNVYSRKYSSVVAKVQAELKSFCGKTYRLAFGLVQRWKKPFGKAKALEFEKKKKELLDTLTRSAWCGSYLQQLVDQILRLVAIVVKELFTSPEI